MTVPNVALRAPGPGLRHISLVVASRDDELRPGRVRASSRKPSSLREASPMTQVAEPRSGTVQSIERVFELLETIADAGGEIIAQRFANASELPMPTIHRLLRPVSRWATRGNCPRGATPRGAVIRWGVGRPATGRVAQPQLQFSSAAGRAANMALLEAIRWSTSPNSPPARMRMFTRWAGARTSRHGVGKAILATLSDARSVASSAGLACPPDGEQPRTPDSCWRTCPDPYAGVRDRRRGARTRCPCYAVTVPQAPSPMACRFRGALPVDEAFGKRAVPVLQSVAAAIGAALHEYTSGPACSPLIRGFHIGNNPPLDGTGARSLRSDHDDVKEH